MKPYCSACKWFKETGGYPAGYNAKCLHPDARVFNRIGGPYAPSLVAPLADAGMTIYNCDKNGWFEEAHKQRSWWKFWREA